jgi:hypothetical protein
VKVAEIVKRVRDTVGDTLVNQFNDETITNWINDAVRECAVENSLLQKTASSSMVVGQAEYNLPTDIYKLHSVIIDNQKVQMKSLNEFENSVDDYPETSTASGMPLIGYVWATKLTVYPAPSATWNLRINYTADPGDIVYPSGGGGAWGNTVPAIPASYHLRIVTYCLAQVSLQDDDQNKYQMFMEEFKTGVVKQLHQTESQEDTYPYITVSARDVGGYGGWDEWGWEPW